MATFELTEPDFDHDAIAARINYRLTMAGIQVEMSGAMLLITEHSGSRWALSPTSDALIAAEVLVFGGGPPSVLLERFKAKLDMRTPRKKDDWEEDFGAVLWWKFPIVEPPYVGTPLDDDFPAYVTHWTHIPLPLGGE